MLFQIERQNQVLNARMHEKRPVPAKAADEHTKLEDNVIAHSLVCGASRLNNVFEFSNRDSEIGILDGGFEHFERIAARPEHASSSTQSATRPCCKPDWKFHWKHPTPSTEDMINAFRLVISAA